MTLTMRRVRPGLFGDEFGQLRQWDGERWGEASDAALLPEALRTERLTAQVRTFERAGYRVVRASDQRVSLVREPKRSLLGVLLQRHRPVQPHRVTISIDRAGAVSFA